MASPSIDMVPDTPSVGEIVRVPSLSSVQVQPSPKAPVATTCGESAFRPYQAISSWCQPRVPRWSYSALSVVKRWVPTVSQGL